ncbi:MAG: hypothetical protein AB7N54_12405 [Alphaproteobacteria bacterium]
MPIGPTAARPAYAAGPRGASAGPAAESGADTDRPVGRLLPVRAPLRGGDEAGPAAAPWLAKRLTEGVVAGPRTPHARGVAAYPTLAASIELFAPGETVALLAMGARPLVVRVA